MTEHPDHPDRELDAYLDGTLGGDERAELERRAASDPALRRAIEGQRAIDASLRRAFGPPPEDRARVIVRAAQERAEGGGIAGRIRRRPVLRRIAMVAAAAVIALLVAGGWLVYDTLVPTSRYDPDLAFASPAEIYGALAERGWEPEWVCEDDAEFAQAVLDRLGQPLLVTPSEDVVVAGWAYSNGYGTRVLSRKTMLLLTEVEGEHVVVAIDRARHDCDLSSDERGGLHIHGPHVIGELLLWEISPRPEAGVLGRFYEPETMPEPEAPEG